jgi:hypothetical protein
MSHFYCYADVITLIVITENAIMIIVVAPNEKLQNVKRLITLQYLSQGCGRGRKEVTWHIG